MKELEALRAALKAERMAWAKYSDAVLIASTEPHDLGRLRAERDRLIETVEDARAALERALLLEDGT